MLMTFMGRFVWGFIWRRRVVNDFLLLKEFWGKFDAGKGPLMKGRFRRSRRRRGRVGRVGRT